MGNNQVVRHFNDIAYSYDTYKRRNRLYYDNLKKAAKSFIKGQRFRLLDIGCGTGDILYFLNPAYGLGIDSSSEMIKIAKKKYKKIRNLEFATRDIEESVPNKKFDYIILLDVVEHLTDISRAFKNISNMMTSKTSLIVSMANPFWETPLMILEKFKLKMPEGPHNRITEQELISIMNKYDLKLSQKRVYLPDLNLPLLSNFALIFVYEIVKSGRL